jgi:hypothetical protein
LRGKAPEDPRRIGEALSVLMLAKGKALWEPKREIGEGRGDSFPRLKSPLMVCLGRECPRLFFTSPWSTNRYLGESNSRDSLTTIEGASLPLKRSSLKTF